ncbi:hypothetical protein E1A91_A05G318100v1 [Gossypium mustelinum]|uniref:Uncharacterized protein n=1 Tax=Gossypium mustelinum TaxID=34275 RepID=A0A5D2ZCT5_GOSMU|nr:hypothetical protein E1A91_A05G318100v1 [Gossypium mustelinum]
MDQRLPHQLLLRTGTKYFHEESSLRLATHPAGPEPPNSKPIENFCCQGCIKLYRCTFCRP